MKRSGGAVVKYGVSKLNVESDDEVGVDVVKYIAFSKNRRAHELE